MATLGQHGIVVGVADMAVGGVADQRITTFALGSCIGITLYDPVAKLGGMLHYMLPQPIGDVVPEDINFAMYASTGLPTLARKIRDLGANKSRLITCVAGGAEVLNDTMVFAIGRRNRSILRKIFWKDGTVIAGEDTGGNLARTLTLELDSGEVRVKTREGEKRLWTPGRTAQPQGAGK